MRKSVTVADVNQMTETRINWQVKSRFKIQIRKKIMENLSDLSKILINQFSQIIKIFTFTGGV